MECAREKEFGSVIREISMLDNLVMIAKMGLDSIFGPMATTIKAIFVKTCEREKETCFGMMAAHTLDSGRGDSPMEKVVIDLIKLGVFKVKGEKPRAGYFEDNVLVS